jgi:hypothetical protein
MGTRRGRREREEEEDEIYQKGEERNEMGKK